MEKTDELQKRKRLLVAAFSASLALMDTLDNKVITLTAAYNLMKNKETYLMYRPQFCDKIEPHELDLLDIWHSREEVDDYKI
jgi:hypothetical protein